MRTWPLNSERSAYIISIDIVGFSKEIHDHTDILYKRNSLFNVFKASPLYVFVMQQLAHSQFLGDELRIAISSTVPPQEVLQGIEKIMQDAQEFEVTTRGMVAIGNIKPLEWKGCFILSGEAVMRLQRWGDNKYLTTPKSLCMDDVFFAGIDNAYREIQLFSDVDNAKIVRLDIL